MYIYYVILYFDSQVFVSAGWLALSHTPLFSNFSCIIEGNLIVYLSELRLGCVFNDLNVVERS